MVKKLTILGIRGIPAEHGGFETFAQNLALFLVDKGWEITVYCQTEGKGAVVQDVWNGVRRVVIPVSRQGAFGTVEFDWRSISHFLSHSPLGVVLVLGYNTAIFCARLKKARIPTIINMDGLEWKREKWKIYQKVWLLFNELAGCFVATHLVADHPEIEAHLSSRVSSKKITTIPYGAPELKNVDSGALINLGLDREKYIVVIARPEPENSILEIVRAFSRCPRGVKLVVLGNYDPIKNSYHQQVLECASPEVVFLGAIYDQSVVNALRSYCKFYIHGHKVGGTNPSLVEALGAGSPVLAHDNKFNRWVAGDSACYFASEDECALQIDKFLNDGNLLNKMGEISQYRFKEEFTWEKVLTSYEKLFRLWG